MVAPDDFTQLHGSDAGGRKAHGAVSGSDHRPMVRADALMYAELHCHSAYSFLDGASPPDEILAAAHSLGYPALALTDRNGIYGSLAFAHAAQPLGIQAITGGGHALGRLPSDPARRNRERVHESLPAAHGGTPRCGASRPTLAARADRRTARRADHAFRIAARRIAVANAAD